MPGQRPWGVELCGSVTAARSERSLRLDVTQNCRISLEALIRYADFTPLFSRVQISVWLIPCPMK